MIRKKLPPFVLKRSKYEKNREKISKKIFLKKLLTLSFFGDNISFVRARAMNNKEKQHIDN